MSPDISPQPFRICLDLNVFVASLLSDARGHAGSATQFLVGEVKRGATAFGPTQLVVSWGMLNRLALVLERVGFTRAAVETITAEIALNAQTGPAELSPLLVLGGTGLTPIRDVEDQHVLETAFIGRARLLVTANFDDFLFYGTTLVEPRRIAVNRRAGHEVVIAHPYVAAEWLRTGEMRLG
ncbi:MAG TPA: PIN domain-containing protein [Longimicrobium sp.]|nr:PIN domain-containing protein [Longimicrobium sp.]